MKDKILSILQDSEDYISGEQISRTLGITRSAVWKYITKLRSEGYRIDSVTNKGYKIEYSPDVITKKLILDNLSTEVFARNIHYYDEITSTNAVAKESCGEPHGTLFIADVQTAGRGRMGRSWESPRLSGIWMSLLLKPQMKLENAPQITLVAGISVCTVLNKTFCLGTRIKWPNDIVSSSKKICGILTELAADTDGIRYIIPGIGINVINNTFPPELESKATSLYLEIGKRPKRYKIVCDIMAEFEKNYNILLTEGFKALLPVYRKLCINIGRDVLIVRNGNTTRAHCVDVSDNGNLIVEIKGKRYRVNSGEVSVRGVYGYV